MMRSKKGFKARKGSFGQIFHHLVHKSHHTVEEFLTVCGEDTVRLGQPAAGDFYHNQICSLFSLKNAI